MALAMTFSKPRERHDAYGQDATGISVVQAGKRTPPFLFCHSRITERLSL